MAKPQVYVGRCIYCDSTEGLTDEHIIPEGLKGNLILGDASCAACQKITCAIEGQVLGKMMGHFRAATGMRRKDRRTKTRKVRITTDAGDEWVEFDVSEIPAVLMLPAFGKAGFLAGRSLGEPAPARLWGQVLNVDKLPKRGEGKQMALAGLGPDVFAQMLAKIALAYAVYTIGLDSMDLTIRPLILGAVHEFGHWVGGDDLDNSPKPATNDTLHTLQLAAIPHNGKHYTAVLVRLFANFGAPTNYVILGEDLPGPPQSDLAA